VGRALADELCPGRAAAAGVTEYFHSPLFLCFAQQGSNALPAIELSFIPRVRSRRCPQGPRPPEREPGGSRRKRWGSVENTLSPL
jgi:hypothetical protein